jgi:hypothetical protein
MALTARKWVPKKNKERSNSFAEIKSDLTMNFEAKADPIK